MLPSPAEFYFLNFFNPSLLSLYTNIASIQAPMAI